MDIYLTLKPQTQSSISIYEVPRTCFIFIKYFFRTSTVQLIRKPLKIYRIVLIRRILYRGLRHLSIGNILSTQIIAQNRVQDQHLGPAYKPKSYNFLVNLPARRHL